MSKKRPKKKKEKLSSRGSEAHPSASFRRSLLSEHPPLQPSSPLSSADRSDLRQSRALTSFPGRSSPSIASGTRLRESRVGGYGFSPSDRDLSALLSYGPSFIPYVSAWTDSRIEQVQHYKHWIYVAINKIATTVARQIPNISYVRTDHRPGNRKAWLKEFSRRKALLPLRTHEQLEPVPDSHPLSRLLKDPNEPDTSYDLWYETILFYLLTGSAYWWLPSDPKIKLANGPKPNAIWVVPSHWMWPIVGKDRLIEGWEIRPVEVNYLRKVLPAEEIIHFRSKNPKSKIDGFSPLTAGAQWGDIQESIDRSQWQSYRNSPMPTVAVEFDGTMHDPSDEDLRRIEQRFIARYSGDQRAGKPVFLPPGVKTVPLQITPNEMAFGSTGEETRDKILSLFGVPASVAMVDVKGLNGASRFDAQAAFYSDTIGPLEHFLGQAITEKLAWRFDHTLRVWWEDRTPDDPNLLNDNIKTDLLAGAICPNEVRLIRGREPLPEPWANKPIIPVNMEPGSLPGGGSHVSGDDLDQPSNEQPALNDEDYKAFQRNGHHRTLTRN